LVVVVGRAVVVVVGSVVVVGARVVVVVGARVVVVLVCMALRRSSRPRIVSWAAFRRACKSALAAVVVLGVAAAQPARPSTSVAKIIKAANARISGPSFLMNAAATILRGEHVLSTWKQPPGWQGWVAANTGSAGSG
jgi:hypothetical protein